MSVAITKPSADASPSWRQPLVSAALALCLVVGVAADAELVWVGVVVAQLLLTVSWHRSLAATAPISGAAVGAALIAAVDVAVVVQDNPVSYGPVAAVLGAGYLAAVLQQLARRDGRPGATISLAATLSLATFGALGVGWVLIERLTDGDALALTAVSATAAAATGRLAPRLIGTTLVPVAAGCLVGVLLGGMLDEVGASTGALIGIAVAVPAVLAGTATIRAAPQTKGWVAGAAWPILAAAPLAYLVIRLSGH